MKIARIAVVVAIGVCLVACGAGTTSQVVAGKKIAFLTPDAAPRFANQDRSLFQAKVQSICSDCEVVYRNAGGDPLLQQQQAEAALSAGANVIVLDAVDVGGSSSIVAAAAKRHVPVIAYDRLTLYSPDIAYYVAFDNAAVGALQGSALLSAMKSSVKPTVVMIHGDPEDRDAAALKEAAHSALDGKVTVGVEYDTPSASSDNAKLEMTQALTTLQDKVDGVYAANDEIAAGAVAALKAVGLKTLPPITGGDAELSAVQRIIAGEQYMTIYKPVKQEAEAAALLAYDMAFGISVPAAMTGGASVDNRARAVPAVLVKPVAVTRKELVTTVLADGFWTRNQICTADYARACKAAGVS